MPSQKSDPRILVTGARGFIGQNLLLSLSEAGHRQIRTFSRGDPSETLDGAIEWADVVVHLAGVNRPLSDDAFGTDNVDLTRRIADAVLSSERQIHVIFVSSIHAVREGPYGASKRAAERILERLHEAAGTAISIYRLPNVFGKWSRPHYNSVVATFCWAAAHDQVLPIDNPASVLDLAYIDDVVAALGRAIVEPASGLSWPRLDPLYSTTVGELAAIIEGFAAREADVAVDRVGCGLRRGLYATYLSHLPANRFSYALEEHRDPRGSFVEVVKTPDCGQVSFFRSSPGVTRGRHYHHTKTEKFLVLQGRALFRYRDLRSGEYFECEAAGDRPRIVQTIPGWAHEIVNLGNQDLLVMVWANEVFDRQKPDTYQNEIN